MTSELSFEIINGELDLQKIREQIEKIPFVFNDPTDNRVYLICGSEDAFRFYSNQRRNLEKDIEYPYSCMVVHLRPSAVLVGIMCDLATRKSGYDFLRWLMANYDFKITDDYGNDLTSKVKKDMSAILEV